MDPQIYKLSTSFPRIRSILGKEVHRFSWIYRPPFPKYTGTIPVQFFADMTCWPYGSADGKNKAYFGLRWRLFWELWEFWQWKWKQALFLFYNEKGRSIQTCCHLHPVALPWAKGGDSRLKCRHITVQDPLGSISLINWQACYEGPQVWFQPQINTGAPITGPSFDRFCRIYALLLQIVNLYYGTMHTFSKLYYMLLCV